MDRDFDVVCVGEPVVDFLPDEPGRVRDVERWHRCPGGAPSNVVIGLARLKRRVALIGVVGDDEFGHFLKTQLATEQVDVSHLRQTRSGKTGLSFVSLTATGERSFSFYRHDSAGSFFGAEDVDVQFVQRAHCLHLGTNMLVRPHSQAAALSLVRAARAAGTWVSCDPNLRLDLWGDGSQLRLFLSEILPLCDVLKLSEEELAFVAGTGVLEEALERLGGLGVKLVVVTRGARGATFRYQGETGEVAAPIVQVADTTGAGDGFTTGLLYALTTALANGRAWELATVLAAARLGVAVGTRVVQHRGAVSGLPAADQLPALLAGLG